jgi:hypothetical protein
MTTNTLPAGLRERELLAARRDDLAARLMDRLLTAPTDVTTNGALLIDYWLLVAEIAALGEVVMGSGDWRRVTVQGRLGGR